METMLEEIGLIRVLEKDEKIVWKTQGEWLEEVKKGEL